MKKPAVKNHMHDILLVAVFLVGIATVGGCLLLAPDKVFSDAERRYLTERPELSDEALTDWQFDDRVEEYLADKMPLRNFFVGVNALFVRLTGRQVSTDIYQDDEGYLVEAPITWEEAETERRLGKIAALGEKTGLTPTVMAVPSTGYIRGTHLPEVLARLYPDAAALEEIAARQGIKNVPLSDAFFAADEQIYYRTDHHWNEAGAYLAYTCWCGETGRECLPLDAYLTHRVDGFTGSTVSRSALWLTKAETLLLYEPDCRVSVTFSDGEGSHDSVLFLAHIGEYDWYPAFLDGNHPLTVIENLDATTDEVLVMVKDSFGNTLAPFLVPSFQTIVMVDPRYYRGAVSDVCTEYGATELLFCYSLERIVNDTNLLLLK